MTLTKQTKKRTTAQGDDFSSHLKSFLHSIDGLHKAIEISMSVTSVIYRKETEKTAEFIKKNGKKLKEVDGVKSFYLEIKDQITYEKLITEEEKTRVALKLVPRSIFVSLVSEFDLLVGNIMKAVLIRYPAIISKEKTLTFEEVLSYTTVKEIEQYFINEEIENVLRGDHAGHVDWFEKKQHIKLKDSLDERWGMFIELTERRNLFVHADGIINSHYLRNCKKNNIKLAENIKKDLMLDVNPEYFKEAYLCLFEISAKLSWLIWRKMESKNIRDIDIFFNNDILVELINRREYVLAERIFSFINKNSEGSEDLMKNVFLINLVLTKKLAGDNDNAMTLLNTRDWSASRLEFKLAVHVLHDEFKEALIVMEKIGTKSDMIDRKSYELEPLYKCLRETKEFKSVFKKIYGAEYVSNENKPIDESFKKMKPKRKTVVRRASKGKLKRV